MVYTKVLDMYEKGKILELGLELKYLFSNCKMKVAFKIVLKEKMLFSGVFLQYDSLFLYILVPSPCGFVKV